MKNKLKLLIAWLNYKNELWNSWGFYLNQLSATLRYYEKKEKLGLLTVSEKEWQTCVYDNPQALLIN